MLFASRRMGKRISFCICNPATTPETRGDCSFHRKRSYVSREKVARYETNSWIESFQLPFFGLIVHRNYNSRETGVNYVHAYKRAGCSSPCNCLFHLKRNHRIDAARRDNTWFYIICIPGTQ